MRKLLKFLKAREGLAAIEFAFLAPVMLTMFFGTVELCNALLCRQKVTNIAATAADLVAQDTSVSDSQMNDIFSALNSIIYPYPSAGAQIIITSLTDDGHGGGTVAWSDAQNTTAHTVGSTMTVPAGVLVSGGSVILAEITYTYNSSSTQLLHSPITMTDSFYAKPRKSSTVARTH